MILSVFSNNEDLISASCKKNNSVLYVVIPMFAFFGFIAIPRAMLMLYLFVYLPRKIEETEA